MEYSIKQLSEAQDLIIRLVSQCGKWGIAPEFIASYLDLDEELVDVALAKLIAERKLFQYGQGVTALVYDHEVRKTGISLSAMMTVGGL